MITPVTAATALVIICRRPVTGIGKQRLARTIGTERALELAELLLATSIEDAAAWPGPVVIAPARAEDRTWAAALLPRGVDVLPQPAGNLGQRLNAVDSAARALGHARLVFVGSDAPVLAPDYYATARDCLGAADVVLGPARDGGVTLMGSRQPWPDLTDLPWGSDHLHGALAHCCRSAGLGIATLPERYDVDLPADLLALCADLADDVRPARRRLYRWLETLGYCRRGELC